MSEPVGARPRGWGDFLKEQNAVSVDRIEEAIRYASFMGYRKIGMACCIGLHDETRVLMKIFRKAGFDVATVMCKTGGFRKADMGVPDKNIMISRTGFGIGYVACNPVAQALILNKENTDLNMIVGLCTGHDAIFTRHAEAPCVTLIAKDRSNGHNPASILYNFYGDNFFGRRDRPDGAVQANLKEASIRNKLRFVKMSVKNRGKK
jgi:uncharacterized metal-binding protein